MYLRSGNVLFLILLAVALFAALSYAVTQSSRSGGNDISREQAELFASRFLQYGAAVKLAFDRARIDGSIKDWQWDFSSSHTHSSSNSACTESKCALFDPAGGGAPIDAGTSDYIDTDLPLAHPNWFFYSIRAHGHGSELPDLVMVLRGVENETCLAINRLQSIPNNGALAFLDGDHAWGEYSGNLSAFPVPNNGVGDGIGDEAAAFVGQQAFCAHAFDSNYGYYVLLAR